MYEMNNGDKVASLQGLDPKKQNDLLPKDNNKINELLDDIMRKRRIILDEFSKAFLAETGWKPSEIMLCEEQRKDGDKSIISWYFQKRN